MRTTSFTLIAFLGLIGCGDGEEEEAGESCEVATDCYQDVTEEEPLVGDAVCLDRVAGGYCTHDCVTDADCCAVPGECESDRLQVCAPFESTGVLRCFLSCEADVIGDEEEGDYCASFAHRDFGCRSTGGGSENRKVCIP